MLVLWWDFYLLCRQLPTHAHQKIEDVNGYFILGYIFHKAYQKKSKRISIAKYECHKMIQKSWKQNVWSSRINSTRVSLKQDFGFVQLSTTEKLQPHIQSTPVLTRLNRQPTQDLTSRVVSMKIQPLWVHQSSALSSYIHNQWPFWLQYYIEKTYCLTMNKFHRLMEKLMIWAIHDNNAS